MERTRSNPLPLYLFIVACIVVAIIFGRHALSSHGPSVFGARSRMDCNNPNGAEMYSPSLDVWMYLCFVEQGQKVAIQVLSEQRDNPQAREITTIPESQIRDPMKYIANVISKRGYTLKSSWGNLPQWFLDLVGGY